MVIVHINGWPGVGKRTIGEALARDIGARFIHNHLLHDVGIVCCGLNDAERWDVYEQVQQAAYKALSRRPQNEVFVMTNALCEGSPREEAAWQHVVNLAETRGVPLIPVVLTARSDEIMTRVENADRVGKKLADARILQGMMATAQIQMPLSPHRLVLDVSDLMPEHAASLIKQHVEYCLAQRDAESS